VSRRKALGAATLLYNSRVSCRKIVPFLLLFTLGVATQGQKAARAKLNYKLLSIHVKGASQLKEDAVIAASGLKLGQFAGEGDFKQAMQKLGNTGLFTDLTYSYHYSSDGCDLEIQITENPELLPIIFDNFVWFSDADLIAQLRRRLPLFSGRLPVNGDLADQVTESLNSILDQRKILGKAGYFRGAKENEPIDSYVYKVNLHPVIVRNLDFPGAGAAELPALQAAGKSLAGQEYLRTKMLPQGKSSLLRVYLARGYLKASFSSAKAKVVEDGPRTLVDVSFPVEPGTQYKLGETQWQGNTVIPVEKLQELVHLKAGEAANAVQLNDDLDAAKKLYGSKGYLFARIDPVPTMDDAQATVSYELNVTEGDLYRMGNLELEGLDADASKKMVAQWQMKRGDPYDNTYLHKFFSIMYRDVGLRRPYNVVPKESVNQQDKTVSVALHFMPKG
jgi:outer membrane protein insertion porin family